MKAKIQVSKQPFQDWQHASGIYAAYVGRPSMIYITGKPASPKHTAEDGELQFDHWYESCEGNAPHKKLMDKLVKDIRASGNKEVELLCSCKDYCITDVIVEELDALLNGE